ncbi:MAG: F0F1 ATP synthase subunit delta [bacterium]|nr:F0F1 ATP synthase subunit delta [bacterium]MDZ4296669.1 F0F1 ATP synthase subunit delta [Patescibacteria group bacterium]
MKYTPRQYARALLEATAGVPQKEQKVRMRQFLKLLGRNGDRRQLARILSEVERQELRAQGLRKVLAETPNGLSPKVKNDIESILGNKVRIEESVRPELLAGVRLVVDGETLIDATAKRQIARMFQG